MERIGSPWCRPPDEPCRRTEQLYAVAVQKEMKGIYTSSVDRNTLDESPMAYKPMETILRQIEPTVKIVERTKPIYNFKASEEISK